MQGNTSQLLFYSFLTADIISTVEFNQDGEFLATGDKGGRVVVFQRDGTRVCLRLSMTCFVYNIVQYEICM